MRHPVPLLLLPAMGCDGQLWARQVTDLVDIAHPQMGDLTVDDSLTAMAARVLAIGAVAALSIFLFGPIDDLTPIGQLVFSLACGAALIGLLRYVSAAV